MSSAMFASPFPQKNRSSHLFPFALCLFTGDNKQERVRTGRLKKIFLSVRVLSQS